MSVRNSTMLREAFQRRSGAADTSVGWDKAESYLALNSGMGEKDQIRLVKRMTAAFLEEMDKRVEEWLVTRKKDAERVAKEVVAAELTPEQRRARDEQAKRDREKADGRERAAAQQQKGLEKAEQKRKKEEKQVEKEQAVRSAACTALENAMDRAASIVEHATTKTELDEALKLLVRSCNADYNKCSGLDQRSRSMVVFPLRPDLKNRMHAMKLQLKDLLKRYAPTPAATAQIAPVDGGTAPLEQAGSSAQHAQELQGSASAAAVERPGAIRKEKRQAAESGGLGDRGGEAV